MHESLLLSNVYRIHLHVRIGVHAYVLEVHVVCGPDEELLVLLSTAHFSLHYTIVLLLLCMLLLLLLQLHVSVLIFPMRQCVIKALGVVPCLLCTLLIGGALGTRSLW